MSSPTQKEILEAAKNLVCPTCSNVGTIFLRMDISMSLDLYPDGNGNSDLYDNTFDWQCTNCGDIDIDDALFEAPANINDDIIREELEGACMGGIYWDRMMLYSPGNNMRSLTAKIVCDTCGSNTWSER